MNTLLAMLGLEDEEPITSPEELASVIEEIATVGPPPAVDIHGLTFTALKDR